MLKRRIVLDDEELAASIPEMPPEPKAQPDSFKKSVFNPPITYPLGSPLLLTQPTYVPVQPYGGHIANVAMPITRWPNARKVTTPPGRANPEQVWALCQASAEKAQAHKLMKCVICKTPNNFDANLDNSVVTCKTCGDEQTINALLAAYEDL